MKKRQYVLGFLFDARGNVTLIRKLKPDWQVGMLNGIGGKIERNETPLQAMRREFLEETGWAQTNWEMFAVMFGKGWKVHCFAATNAAAQIETMTLEIVGWEPIRDATWMGIVPNLAWLIPMAVAHLRFLSKKALFIEDQNTY